MEWSCQTFKWRRMCLSIWVKSVSPVVWTTRLYVYHNLRLVFGVLFFFCDLMLFSRHNQTYESIYKTCFFGDFLFKRLLTIFVSQKVDIAGINSCLSDNEKIQTAKNLIRSGNLLCCKPPFYLLTYWEIACKLETSRTLHCYKVNQCIKVDTRLTSQPCVQWQIESYLIDH